MSSSLQRLSKVQVDNIALYTDDTGLAELKRIYEFGKFDKKMCVTLMVSLPIIGGIGGALIGAGVGAGIGFVIANGPGAAVGAGVGAIVGGVGGSCLGVVASAIVIRNSPKFLQWKINAVRDKVYPLFKRYIIEGGKFDEFLDPITYELIMTPVRCPNGTVYEKSVIEYHLSLVEKINKRKQEDWDNTHPSLKEGKKLELTHPDPTRRKWFTKDDLVYDQTCVKRMYDLARKLLDEDLKEKYRDTDEKLSTQFKSQEFREGVKALVSDFCSTSIAVAKAKTNIILDRCFKDELPKESTLKQIASVFKEADLEDTQDTDFILTQLEKVIDEQKSTIDLEKKESNEKPKENITSKDTACDKEAKS